MSPHPQGAREGKHTNKNTVENVLKVTNKKIFSLSVSFSHSLSLVDDVRLLPLSGCLSLCVHPAAPQGDSGPFTAHHIALLWSQVQ